MKSGYYIGHLDINEIKLFKNGKEIGIYYSGRKLTSEEIIKLDKIIEEYFDYLEI